MTRLAVDYLGLSLAHPIVPGASPIADDIDRVLAYEDAGAAAIVMRSIFEEQIELEQLAAHRHLDGHVDAEAASFAPDTDAFALGLDGYLEQLARIRARTQLVVIGSLNGTTPGGWTDYARRIEQAGAHALELNLYVVPADPRRSGAELEAEQIATVRDVVGAVAIVQTVSALLLHGPARLREMIDGLVRFLDEQEDESLGSLIGNMNLARCPSPEAYERADYIQLLRGWHG